MFAHAPQCSLLNPNIFSPGCIRVAAWWLCWRSTWLFTRRWMVVKVIVNFLHDFLLLVFWFRSRCCWCWSRSRNRSWWCHWFGCRLLLLCFSCFGQPFNKCLLLLVRHGPLGVFPLRRCLWYCWHSCWLRSDWCCCWHVLIRIAVAFKHC